MDGRSGEWMDVCMSLHVCTHDCMYGLVDVCLFVLMYVIYMAYISEIYVCSMHALIHSYHVTYLCMYVCMYVAMYLCMYVCIM